jgi:hypothetical protein
MKEHYTVWVGAQEVNDHLLTKEKANKLAKEYEDEGYVDVLVEKCEIPGAITLSTNGELLTGQEAYFIIEGLKLLVERFERNDKECEEKGANPWFTSGALKAMINNGILHKLNKYVIPVHAKQNENLKNGKL